MVTRARKRVTMADLLEHQDRWYRIFDQHIHELINLLSSNPGGNGSPDNTGVERIMAALDDLATEVGEVKDTSASAVALLDGLKKKLDEAIASGDMGRVEALRDELNVSQQALADAVARNTPADPNPSA
jgi:hypothetical protein